MEEMSQLPGNTNKAKKVQQPNTEVDKGIQQVVTGEVIQRKPSLGKRIKNVLFAGEFKGAWGYITRDVMIPALKGMVVDATSRGVERIMYPNGQSPRRSAREYGGPRVSYSTPVDRSYSSRSRPGMLPDQPPIHSGRQKIDEFILYSREDADLVLDQMTDIIEKFGAVSVADLLALLGHSSQYTDNDWGWQTMQNGRVVQVREGYLLGLPPAQPLK